MTLVNLTTFYRGPQKDAEWFAQVILPSTIRLLTGACLAHQAHTGAKSTRIARDAQQTAETAKLT